MNDITLYIVIGITVLILFIIVIVLDKKNNLQELEKSIFKCEIKLLEALLKKQDLLTDQIRKSKDKQLLKEIKTEEKTNLFDLDKFLYEKRSELNKLIDDGLYNAKEEKIVLLNELEDTIEG